MNLIELINHFRNGGTYEEFCQEHSLNLESEVIEIYMKKPFNLDNDLAFFEIENTEGRTEYVFNGETYFNLFDFYYFQDAIAEVNTPQYLSLTAEAIAKKLYDYAINDG